MVDFLKALQSTPIPIILIIAGIIFILLGLAGQVPKIEITIPSDRQKLTLIFGCIFLIVGLVTNFVPTSLLTKPNGQITPTPTQSTTQADGTVSSNPTPLMPAPTPADLYKTVMANNPTLTDPLTGQDANNWDRNSACAFKNGAYQLSAVQSDPGGLHECFATAIPSLSDFAFQVNMSVMIGNSGGLIFRSTSTTHYPNSYQVGLDVNGYYFFHLVHYQKCHLVPSSFDSNFCQTQAAHQGLGSTNTITVIAKGGNVYLYVNNGTFVDTASSNILNMGFIGFFALCPQGSTYSSTQVEFRDLKIWKL